VSGGRVSFEVVGSTTVADVGFLALSETHVQGHGESFTRFVVHHPGAVVVVPVEIDNETVILVRQFRAATGREMLEVPAGKRDVEGESPESTAERELIEEIGRTPGRLVPLCEFYNSPGFCDEYTHLFAAFDLGSVERAAATIEERTMTVERVAIGDIDRLIATREIIDAKSIIGLLLTRRYLAGEYAGLS
jgi:8-oxo-dGTP pyrophosphatase MutT (NUDIX family)